MSVRCVRCGGELGSGRLGDDDRHECRVEARDQDPYGPLAWIAHTVHQHEAQSAGVRPTRWHAIPVMEQRRLLQAATQIVASWAGPEMQEAMMLGRLTPGKSLLE